MNDLAEKIIELRLATRRACMCENLGSNKKSTLSLKTKVIYLIQHGFTPKEITLKLCIAKTNLALVTSGLIEEGLVTKKKNPTDKREIIFSLTDEGRAYLNGCLDIIESNFKNILTEKKDYDSTLKLIEELLDIFSYFSY